MNQVSLLGLGLKSGSNIWGMGQTDADLTVIERIFRLNETSRNYITVACGRDEYTGTNTISSELTIMEVQDGWDNVLNQPKLSVPIIDAKINNQHLLAYMDKDGFMKSNGKKISLKSSLTTLNSGSNVGGNPVVMFDSGFTYSQVPSSVAKAIYGGVKGAKLQTSGKWTLPCDAELNLSISLGGRWYPVHPLDVNFSFEGNTVCTGGVSTFLYRNWSEPSLI
jgi:hypothetical protein